VAYDWVKTADCAWLDAGEIVDDGGGAPRTSDRREYAQPNRDFMLSNIVAVPPSFGHRRCFGEHSRGGELWPYHEIELQMILQINKGLWTGVKLP
jgi:hypothetical protein